MPPSRACSLALSLLFVPCLAHAQGVRFVDASAPPGGSGLAWTSAHDDLQAALAAAQGNPGISQIWVADGTYRPGPAGNRSATFALRSGLALFGGFAGNETALDQRDPALHPAILDGDLARDDLPGFGNYGDNSLHVVSASSVDSSAVLDGFVVRGGSSAPGAGITCLSATPSLRNLLVRENSGLGAVNEGGGLFVALDAGQALLLEDCTFLQNRSTLGGGASLAASSGGDAFFFRCAFTSNTGTTGAGLALDGSHLGQPRLRAELVDCAFTGNQGKAGGAVQLHSEDACELVARGSSFRSNVACSGSAILSVSETGNDLLVERCSFVDNGRPSSCGTGPSGGISLRRGSLTILQSLLLDNSRNQVWAEVGAHVRIVRSTLHANGNPTFPGLMLQAASSAEVVDSILWGSVTAQLGGNAAANAVVRHSDVRMNGAGLPGAGNFELDPLFVNAAGGDLHLTPGSPCIDAGSIGAVPGADFENDPRLLDGDLDGRLRVDLGADEFAPVRLEVLGVPSPGNPLTFVTTGTPGLRAYLLISTPGSRFEPGVGTFFLDPASPQLRILPWSATPSQQSLVLPPGIPSGPYRFQVLALGGGAAVLTNFVELAL